MVSRTSEGVPELDFAPQLSDLLRRREGVFRIDRGTVGVADPDLMETVVSARQVLPGERSVFKPVRRVAIDDELANAVIRALGHDVARAGGAPIPDLAVHWPRRGQDVLREMLFSIDEPPVAALLNRRIGDSDTLSRLADLTLAAAPQSRVAASARSALAGLVKDVADRGERRRRLAMYRRASAVFIDGLSGLIANAAWLLPPDASAENVHDLLWETLRLLPPAWMLWRDPDPAFAALHPQIRATDAIALLPLLSHRAPGIWEEPAAFRPSRWLAADPTCTRGFTPFGLAGAKCWARHLVLPLAQRLLTAVIDQGLRPRTPEVPAPVPLRPLLSVRLELVPAR